MENGNFLHFYPSRNAIGMQCISRISCNAPNGAIILNFGMRELPLTHTKFFINWFRGFGVVTPQNLAISIGLAGHSYNSVSTAVLHCDPIPVSLVQTMKNL